MARLGELLDWALDSNSANLRGIFEDSVEDWGRARELGEQLTQVAPWDSVSHLLLARACRHLGDFETATEVLALCNGLLGESPDPEFEAVVRAERELLDAARE